MDKHNSSRATRAVFGALFFAAASMPAALAEMMGGDDRLRDTVRADSSTQGIRADNQIETAIREAIKADPELKKNAADIKVVANQGSVILKGNVSSPLQKMRMEILARKESTTKLVENDLEVRN